MSDRSTDQSEPEVRLARPEDVPGMVRVLDAAFGSWPPIEQVTDPVEYLRWKLSRPGPAQAHAVAVVDGAIAAVSVRWGARLQVGAGELMQDGGVDQSVDPAMQGRGLGGKVAAFSHDAGSRTGDLSISSGSKDDRISTIFDRFDPVLVRYPLRAWVRPLEARALLGGQLRGGSATGRARALLRTARRRAGAPVRPPLSGARIRELTRFDDALDPLWEAWSPQFDVVTIRDATYLNWRYADARAGRSLILGAYEGERLVGFAVFKRGDTRANVLDLVVMPERPGVAVELLAAGRERMRAEGARSLTCWLPPDHPDEEALVHAGFLESADAVEIGVGPLRRDGVSPGVDLLYSGHARWHWMLGDQDYT